MRPWSPGSWGLCSLHVVPHPFCSPQEELKQTAPPQEDEAARVEEEAAEEVGAGLPDKPPPRECSREGPQPSQTPCVPLGVVEPSGQTPDLMQPRA